MNQIISNNKNTTITTINVYMSNQLNCRILSTSDMEPIPKKNYQSSSPSPTANHKPKEKTKRCTVAVSKKQPGKKILEPALSHAGKLHIRLELSLYLAFQSHACDPYRRFRPIMFICVDLLNFLIGTLYQRVIHKKSKPMHDKRVTQNAQNFIPAPHPLL